MTPYAHASDLLRACREAVVSCERSETAVERMRSSEGLRGATMGPTGSGERDSMAPVDARMDFESLVGRRAADRDVLVSCSMRVLYGTDGSGGVRALVGDLAADAAMMYWTRAMSWRQVADSLGVAVSTAKKHGAMAVETADSVGLLNAMAGMGSAT